MRRSRATIARALLACIALTIAAGCGDGPTESGSSLPPGFDGLYGRWDWVRSCCGISGTPTTPQSTGFTMLIEFERSDTLRTYRDGALLRKDGFDIRLEPRPGRIAAFLLIGTDNPDIEVRLRADTLELIRTCADCPSDRFERSAR
jgi:hypothetical protein